MLVETSSRAHVANPAAVQLPKSPKTQAFEGVVMYYGYRYYDPETGRWPSRDPIEEEGGVNLYGFVGNDGVGRIDVWGEKISDANFTYVTHEYQAGTLSFPTTFPRLDNGGKFVQVCELQVEISVTMTFDDEKKRNRTWYEQRFKKNVENYYNNLKLKCFSNDKKCLCPNGVSVKLNIKFIKPPGTVTTIFTKYADMTVHVAPVYADNWNEASSTMSLNPKSFNGDQTTDENGKLYTQNVIAHEMGHAFGLDHPGQDLNPPARLNSRADYRADKSSLMGLGNDLRIKDMQKAFCDRLNRINPSKDHAPWTAR